MNFDEYRETINKKVSNLTRNEKVAICLMCSFRLAPFYEAFVEKESWGDNSILEQCRELTRNWLQGFTTHTNELKSNLDLVIPDSEDFGSLLGSYAQNASIVHVHTLDQLETDSVGPVTRSLQQCYDTVDFQVREILDPECKGDVTETQVDIHPLMRNELNWQLGNLQKVKLQEDLIKFGENAAQDESIFNVV